MCFNTSYEYLKNGITVFQSSFQILSESVHMIRVEAQSELFSECIPVFLQSDVKAKALRGPPQPTRRVHQLLG